MAIGAPTAPPLDSAFDPVEALEHPLPLRRRRFVLGARRPAVSPKLGPRIGSINYAVRAPLLAWLEEQERLAGEAYGRYRVLDVGCGTKPYYPFFAERADAYVGLDVATNSAADLVGSADDIPAADGSFDVVVCTQVLEHCTDPARVVRELRRVVAPGGRVLLSTHGVQVYHPAPHDLWRWTGEGLQRLFRAEGDWTSVTVRAGSGPASCIGMLVAIYVDLLLKQAHLRFLARPLIALINGLGRLADRLSGGSETQPGSIHANYHVVAQA